MRDNFSHKGIWYIPANSEEEIYGTLYFDVDSGARLELHGNFSSNLSKQNGDYFDIIVGKLSSGKGVTLYKCWENSSSTNNAGYATSVWGISIVIIGDAIFETLEELRFSSAEMACHNLNEWIGTTGINIERNDGGYDIRYSLPDKISFDIDNNVNAHFGFSVKNLNPSRFSVSLNQLVSFVIEPLQGDMHFDDLLKYLITFQDFLTLCSYETSYPIRIHLQNNVIKWTFNGKEYPTHFDVHYAISAKSLSQRPRTIREFLVNYKDVEGNFDRVLKNWYACSKDIEPVINLLMETFYRVDRFDENRFLNVAQALETFHRRKRKNDVIPDDEHRNRLKEIMSVIPSGHEDFARGRLCFHSNEPTLHTRLADLVEEFNIETFAKILPDRLAFVKDVKNSRNYYTHYDESTKSKALKKKDLFGLTEKMKLLLIAAVLKEVGFSLDLIESLFKRNEYRFRNLQVE
ncbi:ApeA N-terminal domain 1-containing protein [Chitinophaga ginsengisoli]|uniref:Uncharacterized protein n=1 Tax=Chitinophaga ginsengisoli TaxID=363837 RepID=A0A2P8FPQ5_9BACT|nr:HEPN domain-containing protein [Chitinophaga ginsengisoli]PSL23716.1 hypothetical protein CLV42_11772 [Chitinophaga ginsengisoli]